MAHEGARAQLSDTTARARQRYFERLRATPPRERLARALLLSAQARGLTLANIRRQHPTATEEEIGVAFVRRVYGDQLADRFAARRTLAFLALLKDGVASEQQWRDVVGVARAQQGRLALAYLRRWSKDQGTLELLERVLAEAGSVG